MSKLCSIGQGTSRQRGQQVYSPEASVSLKGGRKPVWGSEVGTTVGEVEIRDIWGQNIESLTGHCETSSFPLR